LFVSNTLAYYAKLCDTIASATLPIIAGKDMSLPEWRAKGGLFFMSNTLAYYAIP
jgi:hypothetical protein